MMSISMISMPIKYILSIQAKLEESCLQCPVSHLDFLVAGTDCDLDKLLETVTQLKELHPQLKVCLVGTTIGLP